MPELTFRAARREDVRTIIELTLGGAVMTLADDPADWESDEYQTAFAAIEADPNNQIVLGEMEGEVVATMQITFIPGIMRRGMTRALLENIHVRESRRGKGIGSAMIRHAIELAQRRGCRLVQLTSNKKRTEAHRFYGRLGFEPSHEGFKLYL
ncbi:GNAT family N-acetyltransferase [Cucumibacter marinus]|uniref:GNAT family N-acetyltransferase n=1 Tax=Cucumibacter marinus TaxID=1121252 RepID=UPI000413E2D7|nr:GNAT family N-acetyltransferase [Cucumibacter marinus]